MKTASVVLAILLGLSSLSAGEIVVQKVQGDVTVRHGVTEGWTRVAAGDVLKPDDTMRTGPKGTAVIMVPPSGAEGPVRQISLPAEVIVDLSDVRELSQEELMLKLAMEKVRSTEPGEGDLSVPNATVVHGGNRAAGAAVAENALGTGILQMNGTRVLYANGFYPTCALKALEVFRLYPELGGKFENRLLVAESLEKARLRGDALNEYGGMLKLGGLTPEQISLVQERMEGLRR
jgi:hypothetical protein